MFIIVILGLILIFFLNYKFLGNFYSVLNPVSISIYVWILVVVCHNYHSTWKYCISNRFLGNRKKESCIWKT